MHLILNFCVFYWKPMLWSSIILLLTCLTNSLFVLPITGINLIAYVFVIGALTTWLSFTTLQKFLQQNKPIDLEKLIKTNFFAHSKTQQSNESNARNLTLEIDEFYIKKWFDYISKDATFSEESRQIIEDILKKAAQVQLSIDNQVLGHGMLNLYLKHLKEFRRSLKRKEKYRGKISELYRYSHVCSTSSKMKNYFLNKLTLNLLNHFISWELANSLPYQIFVSIISKTAISHILNLLSNPELLNYFILTIFATKTDRSRLQLEKYNRIKIIKVTEICSSTPAELTKSLSQSSLKSEQITATDSTSKNEAVKTESMDEEPINDSIKSEQVKVYLPKSCKAWDETRDFNSVTFGEDILTIGLIESPEPEKMSISAPFEDISTPITQAKHLLDEMKHITSLENIKTSMKPISDVTVSTYHNIRDFQETTVNSMVKPVTNVTASALHKIGGLHLQDEAAGVVEGILDFGRTKIRKGLRLTGLQDSPVEGGATNLKQLHPIASVKKPIAKVGHVKSDDFESAWINPLLEETSIVKIPSITTQDEASPDLEYEEAGDLASSIAKLRCLLEQKSSESSLSTPCGLSPMPPDDVLGKESEDADEVDGVMPSFYKFCTKTASGVINNTLNTIKTALPGNVSDFDRFDGANKWLFVEANPSEADLAVRMNKLLSERKAFCTVDTAYEAIDSLNGQEKEKLDRFNSVQFDDELDDFEDKMPITKTIFDILCELLADNKETYLVQEPIIKSMLLLFGSGIEAGIVAKMDEFVRFWAGNARIPRSDGVETLEMEMAGFVDAALGGISDYVKYAVGEKTARDALNLFISSLQVQRINQDVFLQIFEIISMKLIEGSKLVSPTPI